MWGSDNLSLVDLIDTNGLQHHGNLMKPTKSSSPLRLSSTQKKQTSRLMLIKLSKLLNCQIYFIQRLVELSEANLL